MTSEISAEIISSFKHKLETHTVYDAIATIADLQCFMEHHIYSVWDFMSLIKYLQAATAPASYPWVPFGDGSVRRFINELVLEEESDETTVKGEYSSHFELYLKAMIEIGADTSTVVSFTGEVAKHGISVALQNCRIPHPSKAFTLTTFDFIGSGKPHQVAAALALGREHIIPCMFRSFLGHIGITEEQAPIFHFYLNRHIHLDEDFHGPLSLRLLNSLCEGDQRKINEAVEAAEVAVQARIDFWDGVLLAIKQNQVG
jgi:hypothetical protein